MRKFGMAILAGRLIPDKTKKGLTAVKTIFINS